MAAIISVGFLVILLDLVYCGTKAESLSISSRCDLASETRLVRDCLESFVDDLDFGQYFFSRPFTDMEKKACNSYEKMQKCVRPIRQDCLQIDMQTQRIFDHICSNRTASTVNDFIECYDKFMTSAFFTDQCFHPNMIVLDYDWSLFRDEEATGDITKKKCNFVQWYLNCSITENYLKSCPVTAEVIRTHYELLINANNSGCELRTTSDKGMPQQGDRSKRCDFAAERYAIQQSSKLRAQSNNLEEYLFKKSYDEIRNMEPCLEYKQYMDKVDEMIGIDCRQQSANLEKFYRYRCSQQFIDVIEANEKCITDLQRNFNLSNCNNMTPLHGDFNALFHDEKLDDVTKRRCAITKWYLECTLSDSFDDACPEVSKLVRTYFEILINANMSRCNLRLIPEFAIAEPKIYDPIEICLKYGNCTKMGCPIGFNYNETSSECVDVDECTENFHTCSQQCINTKGSYRCSCDEGIYKLSRDKHMCYRTDNVPMSFLLAHTQNVWNVTHNAKLFERLLPPNAADKIAMFDYDSSNQMLYYVDVIQSRVERMVMDGKKYVETIQNHAVEGTEGIAVDWIHRNLYSLRHNRLHVQLLDGRFRASMYKGLFRLPRALAANPANYELFASDWSAKPFIVRLAMDGSKAIKIITEDIVWPNAVTLDLYAKRLYWADAFLDKIEMAKFDGSGRRKIIAERKQVPHVFSLSVMDNLLFFTDWSNRGLIFVDKITGRGVKMFLGTTMPPYSVKVYHPALQQPGPNVCEESDCSHICVPEPDGNGTRCLCTDGYVLQEDGFSCVSNCSENEFSCGSEDAQCVNLIYRCDGTFNCHDGWDELGCPPPICMYDERFFPCHDNQICILKSQRCDGVTDCADNSDEKYCYDGHMEVVH